MQLKSIQIYGFKSFADKTTIEFQDGVTGIVGPNGSGKSNITEAIRWVLGEQSAKSLRGNKMPDVIFSGAEKRRSLNFASVSLLFNNSDQYIKDTFNELKITRKVFKNGDSNYLINDRECRLKDITDLFMDTGLGEGNFSIISQGNVEEIVNSNPINRRTIIENVAGIYKYKQQKLVANKNLVNTKENLNRLNDIINEISNRLEPLEQQKNLAKDYLNQKEKYNQLSKNQLIISSKNLAKQTDSAKIELDKQVNQLTDLNQLFLQSEQNQKLTKNKLNEHHRQLENLQNEILKVTQNIQKLENKKALLSQESNFKKENYKRIENEILELKVSKVNLTSDLETINKDLNKQEQILKELNLIVNKNKASTKFSDTISKLEAEYLDYIKEQVKLNHQLESSKQTQHYLDNYQTQLVEENNLVESLKNELKADQKKHEALNNQLAEAKIQIESVKNSKENVQIKFDKLKNNWLEAGRIFEQTKMKLKNLTDLHDNYQVFYQGVANLLKQRQRFSGIIGPVSDVLTIDKNYLKAIETALGTQIQNVVVDNEQSAKEIINYLTVNKLGRVTLLPLTTIKPKFVRTEIKENLKTITGFIGIAEDLVSVDSKLLPVKQFLLGNVIVANNIENANQIGRLIHYQNRIVTLDGQVVNVGGSMTGGANRSKQVGILSQNNEISNLQKLIKQMQTSLLEQEQILQKQQVELDQQTNLYQDEAKSINELNQQVTSLKLAIENKEQMLNQQISYLENLKGTATTPDISEKDLQKAVENIKIAIEKNQSELKRQKDLLAKSKVAREEAEKNLSNENQEFTRLRYDQKNTENNLAVVIEKITALNQEVIELKATESGTFSVKNIDNEIEKFANQKADITQQIFNNKAEIDELNLELNSLDEAVKIKQQNLLLAKQEITNLTDQKQRLAKKLNDNLFELENNFGINAENVYETDTSDINIETLNTQLELIKKGLNELGNVNVNAISEYEEVNQRYDFLTTQRDDLLTANHQLEESMKEMNATITDKFNLAFNQVAKRFSEVFKEMFGGGKAELVLTEPDNILETGIEIMAMPPGKTYRNLNLLSGGEKALTAISLLFAILKVKPVPFCILDEAEASLDPANVDRFAQYLKLLEKSTQFIVVTHRKETMVYADSLYGVTMQESGVTKIVTVNLKDLVKEGN